MQNNISARTAHCFVYFFLVTARLRMKFSLATFYGGRKHMTNFSLFPNLGVVLKDSFPGKFTYIRYFEHVRILKKDLAGNC